MADALQTRDNRAALAAFADVFQLHAQYFVRFAFSINNLIALKITLFGQNAGNFTLELRAWHCHGCFANHGNIADSR